MSFNFAEIVNVLCGIAGIVSVYHMVKEAKKENICKTAMNGFYAVIFTLIIVSK